MEKITPISVSLKQACLLIGLSQSKLRQLVKENAVPYWRCGKRILFNVEELNLWARKGAIHEREGDEKND